MDMPVRQEFDAIIVGSGPGGASIARELTRQRKRVLVLERGRDVPLKESVWALAPVLDAVSVGKKLMTMRALTTGGSTAFYGAIADLPPLDEFRALGLDLGPAWEQVRQELSVAPLPDELLGDQVKRVRDSAVELGIPWSKRPMLVDQSRCPSGYSYEAKWSARGYLREAVQAGAHLITRATADKILTNEGEAIGVEYRVHAGRKKFETRQSFASKIVLCAGALATPGILRNSGMRNVANRGFYCDPCMTVLASVPGLQGRDSFTGSMGTHQFEDDIRYGDGSLPRFLYRLWMFETRQFRRLLSSNSRVIGAGFILKDAPGGSVLEDGRYNKELSHEERLKLQKGLATVKRILLNAGGRDLWCSGVSASIVGGLVCIREHVDEGLQTEYLNLHVCDSSILPQDVRMSPTLTLICLGKFLGQRLARVL
jgi:choline dehydrogenase-like flavoprotein